MRLFLLFLLGGAGTAVIAGPCKSSTSSSTGQVGYASAAPEYETSIIGSVSTSAIRYENPGVNQSDESDYVPSGTSAMEMPSGSNSTSSGAERIRDSTTTYNALSGIATKTKPIRTGAYADTGNTETGSKVQSSGIVSNIETVSGSTGDINNPAVTQTGLPASETGANAASTRSGILGGVKTDVGDNQTTNTTEPVALTPTDTATILTKESAVPKNSDSVSGSTEIDNTVTKATAAGSEKTGTGTRTFVQDDNQNTAPATDSNGSVIVRATTSIGSSPDSSRTSTGGPDGQGTTAGSGTRALTSSATDTRSGLSPSVKTSSGQPIESSPSGSDAPKQEPSGSNSAIQTNDKTTKDDIAVPTVTNSSPPKNTDTTRDATITSASGPISTTKSDDDGITSTLTAPPETFTPTTVSNDDWTTNTWITTTSKGSDEPTVVPVLVGCTGCGGSGHGIVIFGLPHIPNTLFKFPGLPEVSLPCIPSVSPGCNSPPKTHDDKESDDDDDDDEEEEKSSKTTCTNIITASDCLVSCPTQGSNGEAKCTTTCTRTQTGCNVSGITTTTSAKECSATEIGGSCTTCQKDVFFVNDKEEVEFIESDSVLERRASLHVVENSTLRKRSSPAVTITDLGVCTLKKTDVEFPGYPSGGELFRADTTPNEKPTDTYFNTKKWYIGRQNPNTCARTLDKVTKQQFNSLAVSKKKTMDHVYEKSMLKDFFKQILDDNVATVQGVTKGSQGKINCADLSYYTDDDPNGASPNQLKQVFDAFPSINKYLDDFMGMDEYSNAICKGTIVSSGNLPAEISKIATSGKLVKGGKKPTTWTLITKWVEETLQTIEKLSIGVELWNNPDVQTIVIRQNRRIHSRFVNIDNNANCKQDVAVKNNVWSFSVAYQNYMNEFFQGTSSFSVNPIIQKAADDLIAHMDANLVTLGKRALSADEQTQLTKWTTRYAPLKTSTYRVSISWDFSYTNLKRQDGGSCALPTSSLRSSAASTTMSTLSTSYISQTNQEPTATEQTTHTETETGWSGSCPTILPFIEGKANLTDEVDDRCLYQQEPPAIGTPVSFNADQLEDILQDFCDGSRTLIKPGEQNTTNMSELYKLGDSSQLFIAAPWTFD
ncbi:unnamed protein product [Fusarium graminearum]|nr:unnamed protein product [Fusarium graminearum]CZS84714.1 unnamed protein product [Fusarium graminearum]